MMSQNCKTITKLKPYLSYDDYGNMHIQWVDQKPEKIRIGLHFNREKTIDYVIVSRDFELLIGESLPSEIVEAIIKWSEKWIEPE